VGGPVGALMLGVELNRHSFGFTTASKIGYSYNIYNPSNNYKGIQYQYTFYREKNLHVGIMLRGGHVDDQFLAYVPALMFDFIFNDYLKFAVSAGVRGQLPSVGFYLSGNLPLKKHEFPNPIF
jgi:hypothetical protein